MMKNFLIIFFLVFSLSAKLLPAQVEVQDKEELIYFGQINHVSSLHVDKNDGIIGIYYRLDNGLVLLDPGVAIISTTVDGVKKCSGGSWGVGEFLFISIESSLEPNTPIIIYNADRDVIKCMSILDCV